MRTSLGIRCCGFQVFPIGLQWTLHIPPFLQRYQAETEVSQFVGGAPRRRIPLMKLDVWLFFAYFLWNLSMREKPELAEGQLCFADPLLGCR